MSSNVIAVVIHGFEPHHRTFANDLMSTVKSTSNQLFSPQHDIHWLPVNIDWISVLRADENNDPLQLKSWVIPIIHSKLQAAVNLRPRTNTVLLNTSLQAVIESKIESLIDESNGILTLKTPVIIASGLGGSMTSFQFHWRDNLVRHEHKNSCSFAAFDDQLSGSANDSLISVNY